MESRNNIDIILESLEFTEKEKEVLLNSIQYIKRGQTEDSFNASQVVNNTIKELINNEIS